MSQTQDALATAPRHICANAGLLQAYKHHVCKPAQVAAKPQVMQYISLMQQMYLTHTD
jgi:hypothetical protein